MVCELLLYLNFGPRWREGGGVLVLLEKITSHPSFALIMLPAIGGLAAMEDYNFRLKHREAYNLRTHPPSHRCQPQSSRTFTKPGLVCREHSGTLCHLKCNLGS